jgi:NADH dehydrogenase [ubiquinone] 1 alpha subcomplex assembly factor 1
MHRLVAGCRIVFVFRMHVEKFCTLHNGQWYLRTHASTLRPPNEMQAKVHGFSVLTILLAFFVVFLTNQRVESSSYPAGKRTWKNLLELTRKCRRPKTDKTTSSNDMGQAVRIMKYDRAANENNAIGALNMLDQALKWHRLDDGVMGGQSETNHSCLEEGELHFTGAINTDGGGFCSIRTPIPEGLPPNTKSISLRFKGDGKTYKLILSDGSKSTFGPSKRKPSWQFDIPTKAGNHKDEEITIPLSSLKPSWGGGPASQPSDEERDAVEFDANSMREIGLMLSLKLSDGRSNPVETFGVGVFPFSLKISSIRPLDDRGKAT